MATYNKNFELTIKDIELIENAVRYQIGHLARTEASNQTPESISNHNQISELMRLLGTLHNQKIWYSQTHHTGLPLG
ncbi:MAG: hypothetical protein ACU833_09980 [Gammaproteobacteria bacterium]